MQSLKSALHGLLLRAQLRCDDVRDWFHETEPLPEVADAPCDAGGLTAVMPLEQRRVLSVVPVVAAPLPVMEGDAAVLTFDFTDTDATDTFRIEVDWDGNGFVDVTDDPTATLDDRGDDHTFSVAAPFSTADDGSFPISIRVTDNNGDAGTLVDTPFVVENVAPTIALSGNASVDEGSAYTLTLEAVTDPGDDTVTAFIVDWGDGSDPETFTTAGDKTHTYAKGPADVSISVALTDEDGTHAAAGTLDVTVNNVAPTIEASSIDVPVIAVGDAATLTFDFTDPGLDDTFTVFADWQDGRGFVAVTGTVTTSPTAAGRYTFTGESDITFTTTTPPPIRIEFYVVDNAGDQSQTETAPLTVNDLLVVSDPSSIDEGSQATLTISVTQPKRVNDVTVLVDWGAGFVDVTPAQHRRTFVVTAMNTFPDDGVFNIVVQLNAGSTVLATRTVDLTVNNVAPAIALSGAASVDEGSAYTLTLGAVTDPGDDTVTAYIVNWGDGSAPETFTTAGDKTHTYADGPADVSISVALTDEDGTHAAAGTLDVTVNNVAPTIALSGAASVDEGSAYTLTLGAVTDPGDDTVTAYIVDWGDGSAPETFTTAGDKTHTYVDGPADVSISVALTDEDGTHAAAGTLDLTVNNVAPTIALSGDASVDEGSAYTLTLGSVTDPGDDTVTAYIVDWGDGSDPETFTTAGDKTHTYAKGPADVSISVALTDEDGTHAAAGTLDVTVNNVAPTIEASSIDVPVIAVGDAATLTFDFTDPGLDDTFTVFADWQDGRGFVAVTGTVTTSPTAAGRYTFTGESDITFTTTTPPPIRIEFYVVDNAGDQSQTETAPLTVNDLLVVSDPSSIDEGSQATLTIAVTQPKRVNDVTVLVDWGAGFVNVTPAQHGKMFVVTAMNTFPDDGVFNIVVQLNAGSTVLATRTVDLTVNNVAPTIALSGAASVDEGSAYTLTLGAVTDPGDDTVTAYIVNWGDGSAPETFTTAGDKTHTYADGPADVSISVALTDEDGTHAAAGTLDVTVNNVAPTIALSGAASVDEGSAYTLTLGAVTDPGDDTVTAYIVDWGDGSAPETFTTAGDKTHTYVDGPADVSISVDLTDEDSLYTDAGTLAVMVNNVAPTIDVQSITASDIDRTSRTTTLTVIFNDPGLRDFVDGDAESMVNFRVDWGDSRDGQLQNSSFEDLGGGTWRLTADYQYNIRQATNQAVEFTIMVSILDKDGAESNVATTIASAPQGIQVPQLIATTAPPVLNLQLQPVSTPVFDAPTDPPSQAEQSSQSSTPPATNHSESHVEIRAVLPDGSEPEVKLERDDTDDGDAEWEITDLDEILDRLQRKPANRYRIYLVQDGVKRLILDVVIREGRIQDAEELDDPLDAVLQRMEQSLSGPTDVEQPGEPATTDVGASNPPAEPVPQEAGSGAN